MIPLLRAETRKLLSIRSTYILLGVAALLMVLICFWGVGLKAPAMSPDLLTDAAGAAAPIAAVFIAITGVLLVAHEYRFNTIMYTLASANSRTKVLLAKMLVASAYTLLASLAALGFGLAMAWLGFQLRSEPVAPQQFDAWHIMWTSAFLMWGYTMVGLFVALLVRHVVGAVVVLLIVPGTIEGLLGIVLKKNAMYLPFSALEQVATASLMSSAKAAGIFLIYVVVGWLIAWALFLKRDAN